MARSSALTQFEEHLSMAEALLQIEGQFDDPPEEPNRTTARGLRGGAVVLMVAAFENFIKTAVQEHVIPLTRVHFSRLDVKIRKATVLGSLKLAMEGPAHERSADGEDRLSEVEAACRRITEGTISPQALASTKSNPNSATVREVFKRVAFGDVFKSTDIKARFDEQWDPRSRVTATDFIPDKLDEIVNLRHKVAHTADTLSISREQLSMAVHFFRLLARILDDTLRDHVLRLVPPAGTTGDEVAGAEEVARTEVIAGVREAAATREDQEEDE